MGLESGIFMCLELFNLSKIFEFPTTCLNRKTIVSFFLVSLVKVTSKVTHEKQEFDSYPMTLYRASTV